MKQKLTFVSMVLLLLFGACKKMDTSEQINQVSEPNNVPYQNILVENLKSPEIALK